MTTKEINQIGTRIRNLRKEKNLSQEEVAKQLDVSRQAVTRWETGRALPSSGHMLKLAEVFGVSVEGLTGEAEIMATEVPIAEIDAEVTLAGAKTVPTLEELKAEIKAEVKRCIWAVWALLLTILFFVVCWFFNEYLGWRVYVWHYMDLYCYAWTACFLVFLGGILQKKRFVASICAGCVLTVLVGQLIALYTRNHSPLRLNESWIALIIFWNLALIVGLFLEYRAKKAPWKTRTKVWMSCVVLLFALVSFGGFKTNYAYNRGSEDGYWAGYEAGLRNAKTGEENWAEQEDKDCLEYRGRYNVGTTMWGMSRYKGFFMHWYTGYEAGYEEGKKE